MKHTPNASIKILPGLFFLILTLSLGACRSSTTVVKHYYLLENEITGDSLLHLRFPEAQLEVAAVEVAPALATEAIALREKSHQLRYFENHRWAVRPDANLHHLILTHLSSAHLFQRVAERFWQQRAAYRLETRVQRLDVEKRDKALYAVLQLDFSLIETAGGQTILKQPVKSEERLEDRDLNTMAAALSRVLAEEMKRLTRDIEEAVATQEESKTSGR
ncbi:ABC-type transport auxiliary lipoprotein family protein [Geofilum rhodophaeum]|uniref:ABC-type transport auxiliary lipoprotein family protein n=1 Tax=Geofilum rhodophaeum TaxID=1965019 RepID=UPI001314584A|nr:PqiC family protein [Geofilum rhodophaeum]